MRIAVIGYGGVGKAFVSLLAGKRSYLASEGLDVKLNYVINSSGGIYDQQGIDVDKLTEFSRNNRDLAVYEKGGSRGIDFSFLMERGDVDLVVEMTPTNKETGEPGMTHVKRALENGINVITSNKGPVLLAYRRLNALAARNDVQLGIGCTTGGALPSVNGGLMDMAGSKILSIEGVLNGTTNFILNEMERNGVSYGDALRRAQDMGIAETDPTLDVEGWDTASKLLILTNVLMNADKTLHDISVEGITGITVEEVRRARQEGRKYKLVGRTVDRDGSLEMAVRLEALISSHPLYGVDGKNKAVRYTSDILGDLTIMGGASGVVSAAASILRDLVNIHRGYRFTPAKGCSK